MEERFFYHSFPRRGAKEPERLAKGMAIVASFIKSGFLLTPEVTEWREFLQDGSRSEAIRIFQKRICFTDLAPWELSEHSRLFGPFALEFTPENLRLLGAIPVFYLPVPGASDRALEGIPPAFVARLADIQELLARLTRLASLVQETPDKDRVIDITRDGAVLGTTRSTIGGAEDLLAILSREIQGPEHLLNSVRALAGFYYPTENLSYTGPLAYYRQREWRIIANMVKRGVEVTREPSVDEQTRLCEIDPEFFRKTLAFPTGEYRRVDQCRYLSEVEGKPTWTWARRLVVPDDAIGEAERLLRELSCGLEVVGSSGLA